MDKLFSKLLILFSLIIIFLATFFIQPSNYGDGPEYNIMLESIYNHQSVNQAPEDAKSLVDDADKYNWAVNPFEDKKYNGFYTAKDENLYSYHFWLYSLNALPARIFTGIFGLSPLISFQIFNSIILLILTLFITKLIKNNKIISALLIIFNLSFWFIHWNHPEYWTFALVMVSLLLFHNKKYNLPIFLSAIASTQNPPIIFLTAFFGFYNLYNSIPAKNIKFESTKIKLIFILKQFLSTVLLGLVALLPYIFYYIYFGTPNLISKVGGTDLGLISFKRVFELFFDPGIGLFFFQPVVTIAVFITAIYSLVKIIKILINKQNKFIKRILDLPKSKYFVKFSLFIVLIAMLLLSSSTTNWNHGSSGPSRYVIWSILPIGLYFIISFLEDHFQTDKLITDFRFRNLLNILKQFKKNLNLKFLLLFIIILGIVYSTVIIILGGFLVPNGRFGNGGFNVFQRAVLDYIPSAYNPDVQIFQSRAECNFTGKGCEGNVWIYYKNEKCRKALVGENGGEVLNQKCGYVGSLDSCVGEFCYYSY